MDVSWVRALQQEVGRLKDIDYLSSCSHFLTLLSLFFTTFSLFRNPEKGAFARGALRKFVANCAPNLRKIAGNSFRTSHEGCAKLSQFPKSILDNLVQIPLFQCPLLEISDLYPFDGLLFRQAEWSISWGVRGAYAVFMNALRVGP